MRWIRYVWAAPASLIGVILSVLAAPRGRAAIVDGVVEIHGPPLAWVLSRLPLTRGGVAAITFGHVVLGRDPDALEWTRMHERVHVAQYERWGPLFLPAYLAASVWALGRGGHPYRDNCFEREARG